MEEKNFNTHGDHAYLHASDALLKAIMLDLHVPYSKLMWG